MWLEPEVGGGVPPAVEAEGTSYLTSFHGVRDRGPAVDGSCDRDGAASDSEVASQMSGQQAVFVRGVNSKSELTSEMTVS